MAKKKIKKFVVTEPKQYKIKDRTCIFVKTERTDDGWIHTIKDINTGEFFENIPDEALKKYL